MVEDTPESLPSFRCTKMMTTILLASTLIPMCLSQTVERCVNHEALRQQGHVLLTKIIPCDYIKDYLPPRNDNQSLKIEFHMIVHDINSINEADMDFRLDMFLHMTWEDTRLDLTALGEERISLSPYSADFIWIPDPYITNAKKTGISSLNNDFASITVFKNKSVQYSARFFTVLGCQMEFHQYPRDIQNCSVIFQSFKYSGDEIQFVWRPWSSVVINEKLKLLEFFLLEPLKRFQINSTAKRNQASGKNSQGLVVVFEFHRQVGHHLVQTYIPSFLLVSLSWFSFWMGLDAIPGRVTLLVTSLLTFTTIFNGIQSHLPAVAYIKAIDVWMGGCMVFIFAALGEFTIIKVLKETHKQKQVNPSTIRKLNGVSDSSLDDNVRPQKVLPFDTDQTKVEDPNKYSLFPQSLARQAYPYKLSQSQDTGSHILRMWNSETGPPVEEPELMNRFHRNYNANLLLKKDLKQVEESRRVAIRWFDHRTGREKLLYEEIDKCSRVIFPITFLLFMIIYFVLLYTRSF